MELPLRNRAGVTTGLALVDDDFPYAERRWSRANTGYVQGFVQGQVVHLHRIVMGLVVGDHCIVDHINRNKLDNRRANLRIVTPGESSQLNGKQNSAGTPARPKRQWLPLSSGRRT